MLFTPWPSVLNIMLRNRLVLAMNKARLPCCDSSAALLGLAQGCRHWRLAADSGVRFLHMGCMPPSLLNGLFHLCPSLITSARGRLTDERTKDRGPPAQGLDTMAETSPVTPPGAPHRDSRSRSRSRGRPRLPTPPPVPTAPNTARERLATVQELNITSVVEGIGGLGRIRPPHSLRRADPPLYGRRSASEVVQLAGTSCSAWDAAALADSTARAAPMAGCSPARRPARGSQFLAVCAAVARCGWQPERAGLDRLAIFAGRRSRAVRHAGWCAAGSAAGCTASQNVMRRRWARRLWAFPRRTLRSSHRCARSLPPPSLSQRLSASRRPRMGLCLQQPSRLFWRPVAARPWLQPRGLRPSHRRRHGPRARRCRRRRGRPHAAGSAGRVSDGEQTGVPQCPSPANSPAANACAGGRATAGGRGGQRPGRRGPSATAPCDTSSDSAIVDEGPHAATTASTPGARARVARASWEWLDTVE